MLKLIFIILVLLLLRKFILSLLENNLPPELNLSTLPKEEIENLDFGKEFDFGTATAAYQIEKSVGPSNWSKFETVKDENGRPKAPDHRNACEGIEHFDEDLEIMKNANLKRYRFGVSWSAIEKRRGEYDDNYIKNYVTQCDKLKRAGIEPMITLWHFEYPEYVDYDGGLLSPTFVEDFSNFAEHVVSVLKGHCRYFYTINEPLGYTLLGYLGGTFPPGHKFAFREFFKANAALMEAHARVYHIIHEIIPDAMVSLTNQVIPLIPKHKWSLLENIIASGANGFLNRPYMDCLITGVLQYKPLGITLFKKEIPGLKDSIDFHGVNHYTCIFPTIDPRDWNEIPLANRRPNNDFPLSDFHWSCIPHSLALVVTWVDKLWNPRHLPIIVSEHGVSDAKDEIREQFVMQSLGFLKRAINYGVPVTGYLAWSLLDNYEWADGYTQHFGFVKVNLVNQTRTPQPSLESYSKLAAKSK